MVKSCSTTVTIATAMFSNMSSALQVLYFRDRKLDILHQCKEKKKFFKNCKTSYVLVNCSVATRDQQCHYTSYYPINLGQLSSRPKLKVAHFDFLSCLP